MQQTPEDRFGARRAVLAAKAERPLSVSEKQTLSVGMVGFLGADDELGCRAIVPAIEGDGSYG
jgi:hypothetical protein